MRLKSHLLAIPPAFYCAKKFLTKLQIDKGDVSHVIENENGIELSPSGPEYEHQLKVPEDTTRGDHDI